MTLDFYLDKNTDKIKLNLIAQEAVKLPSEISEEFFIAQFKRDEFGYFVDTPIGRVDFDGARKAWNHLLGDNTYFSDRSELSGAFMEVLESPLFVVRQKYLLKSTALDRPRSSQLKSSSFSQKQSTKSASGKSKATGIIADSFVFVKPYFKFDKKDNKEILYLASFAIDKNGKFIHKTFYDLNSNIGKFKAMLKTPAKDVLYFKYDNKQFNTISNSISTNYKQNQVFNPNDSSALDFIKAEMSARTTNKENSENLNQNSLGGHKIKKPPRI